MPNRLGLAHWLVDEANPLTARVAVNRAWEQFFGRGMVETSEDFGTQGAQPSHPELLDWLATEFVKQGWRMKPLHKLIVTSATYRQSSAVSPALVERDPYNRLLARGPRFRLEAEMVRDVALAASGLLSRKIGGPSVFPPQPDGIWDIPYSSEKWTLSEGEDRYRRGIYTFIRRSAAYPSFMTFDATSREFCTVRRVRTNTPLQALTTMNDEAFFEAARALAARVLGESPVASAFARAARDPAAELKLRATYVFRLVRHERRSRRAPTCSGLYTRHLARFRKQLTAGRLLEGLPRIHSPAGRQPASHTARIRRRGEEQQDAVLPIEEQDSGGGPVPMRTRHKPGVADRRSRRTRSTMPTAATSRLAATSRMPGQSEKGSAASSVGAAFVRALSDSAVPSASKAAVARRRRAARTARWACTSRCRSMRHRQAHPTGPPPRSSGLRRAVPPLARTVWRLFRRPPGTTKCRPESGRRCRCTVRISARSTAAPGVAGSAVTERVVVTTSASACAGAATSITSASAGRTTSAQAILRMPEGPCVEVMPGSIGVPMPRPVASPL